MSLRDNLPSIKTSNILFLNKDIPYTVNKLNSQAQLTYYPTSDNNLLMDIIFPNVGSGWGQRSGCCELVSDDYIDLSEYQIVALYCYNNRFGFSTQTNLRIYLVDEENNQTEIIYSYSITETNGLYIIPQEFKKKMKLKLTFDGYQNGTGHDIGHINYTYKVAIA